jgi:hypothetical protein
MTPARARRRAATRPRRSLKAERWRWRGGASKGVQAGSDECAHLPAPGRRPARRVSGRASRARASSRPRAAPGRADRREDMRKRSMPGLHCGLVRVDSTRGTWRSRSRALASRLFASPSCETAASCGPAVTYAMSERNPS